MAEANLRSLRRAAKPALGLAFTLAAASAAHAQITFSQAVSLAVAHSPKVQIAQADVDKARAALAQTKDVYIPAVDVGAGLGDSYGYSPNPPTLFTFTAQSLVYSASQRNYIRSATAGLESAGFALADAREAAAEDAADGYAALVHDEAREAVLREEFEDAERLVTISADRLAAGRDNALDLNGAQLTRAQLHLSLVHNESETATDRAHLAALIGIPASSLKVENSFPRSHFAGETFAPRADSVSSGVAAAFANARAKQQQARGDQRFLYRPQIALAIQYNRYATFADSFKALQALNGLNRIGPNDEAFGVQITIPLFDKLHQARARESAADAAHALHAAEDAQLLAIDGETRLANTLTELHARAEVVELEQQRAQIQLDALVTELNAPPVEGRPPLTPKDEQNARMAEREKYLAVLDATFQLRQAEINLLRATGGLEAWAGTTPVSGSPSVQTTPAGAP